MKPLRKLLTFFRKGKLEANMAEEMRFHLEMRKADNLADGLSPEEAAYAAQRKFGNIGAIQEQARDGRGWVWLEHLSQDVRYAFRALRRNPLFTSMAVTILALGIGANTAVFSVFKTVLLRPLPYHEPDRLVAVWEQQREKGDRVVVSSGNYLDWQEQNTAFEALGAYGFFGGELRADGSPQAAAGARLTPGFLEMLGARPLLGRTFANDEEGAREMLISYACWQTRFAGRPDIVGQTIYLDDNQETIIGVMPAAFEFPSRQLDFWLPLHFDAKDRESRRTHEWRVVARLKQGVSLAAAQASLDVVVNRITAAHPQFMTGWSANLVPYHADLVRNIRPTILILCGIVAVVLLVACTNVANLMLARAAGRQRELAIREALGAGRGRIVRQLITEAAVLAGLGTVAGLGLALGAAKFLTALIPGGLPGIASPAIDAGALGFAAGALMLATGIVGIAPAWWLSRTDPRAALQDRESGSGSVLLHGTRNCLLVTQLALATVLLIGAGLLLRSMASLHRVDFGFDPKNLLVATVRLPGTHYRTIAAQVSVTEQLCERLKAISGVQAAAGISDPPLSGTSTFSFVIEGRPRGGPNPREDPVEERSVTPEYFQTIKLRLLSGRFFGVSDDLDHPAVAIVNRTFVSRYFRDAPVMGQRISFAGQGGPWVEIVGVVGDVKDAGQDQPAAPAIYTPYAQKRILWQSNLSLVIRVAGDPELVRNEIKAVVSSVGGGLALPRIDAMTGLYDARLTERNFMTQLIGGFAALTLILGVIGLYGVIAYSVARRQREFGICLALGAARWDIMRRVLDEGLKWVVVGTLLGAAGAWGLVRFLRNLLFEIQPTDPLTFISVVGLLVGVSLVALWLPARRAAKADPMVALRAE